ncbi:MAG: M28 family peptidase [Candidatus Thorarchaeota archaeon]
MSNESNKIHELKERINKIIKDYDNQGIHRTGTKVDSDSAYWLRDEIKKIGLKSKMEEFSFNRIGINEASLEINNRKIDGIPLFDSVFSDEEFIKGKLGKIKDEDTIGISRVSNNTVRKLDTLRKSNKHLGLVFVTEGNTPGLSLINAINFLEPFGPPTLQISSNYFEWITSNLGNEAILTFKIKKTNQKAFNIVSRLKGKDSNLNPMVIMTPRSGWWNCASERAGGIAILLEIMRSFYLNMPKRDVIFLATSGHELGHLGLDSYLEKNSSLIKNASCWIHLGANLSTIPQVDKDETVIPSAIIQTSNSKIESLSLEALKKFKIIPKFTVPGRRRPWGEAQNIFDGRGQYFSIIDTNHQFFHHPNDRWPHAVDINKTASIAIALIDLSKQLVNW